jgi:DNA-binding NtrC family response regulator
MPGRRTIATALQRTLRVIVVEDEMRYRTFLTDVLREMDCDAVGASTADEAARLIGTAPPDVLLLDLNLPVVDGMSFLERFRRTHADTPVVIITGFGDLQSAQRAIHLGVTEFLLKPCHLGQIEQALDRARRGLARLDSGATDDRDAADEPCDPDGARPLAVLEREAILDALRTTCGNRSAAAARLGISRRALYNKIAEYRGAGFNVP